MEADIKLTGRGRGTAGHTLFERLQAEGVPCQRRWLTFLPGQVYAIRYHEIMVMCIANPWWEDYFYLDRMFDSDDEWRRVYDFCVQLL